MRVVVSCIAILFTHLVACSDAPRAIGADSKIPAAGVHVEQAWARATPPGVTVGAAYAVIRNAGEADRLLAVEADASPNVEMHRTQQQDDVAQMRMIDSVEIPADGRVAFEPGGLHLMLNDLVQPLQQGEQIALVFAFEKAGRIAVQAHVAPLGATEAPAGAGHAHQH